MKVSELISSLQEIHRTYGDLTVKVFEDKDADNPVFVNVTDTQVVYIQNVPY